MNTVFQDCLGSSCFQVHRYHKGRGMKRAVKLKDQEPAAGPDPFLRLVCENHVRARCAEALRLDPLNVRGPQLQWRREACLLVLVSRWHCALCFEMLCDVAL